jgi:hypothetical protein
MVASLPDEPPDRLATGAAHLRLNAVFGFSPDAYSQDWDVELADGERLLEFVDAYSRLELSDDERFALMELIVASAHDALDFHGMSDGQWRLVHDLIVADSHLHACTIYYWCCVNASCQDECFTLTSRMRDAWNDAHDADDAMPPMPDVGTRSGGGTQLP